MTSPDADISTGVITVQKDESLNNATADDNFKIANSLVAAGSKEEAILMALSGNVNVSGYYTTYSVVSGAFRFTDHYTTVTNNAGLGASTDIGPALAFEDAWDEGDDDFNDDFVRIDATWEANFMVTADTYQPIASRDTSTDAVITLTRYGDISSDATVYFTLSGSATEGTDYSSLTVSAHGNHYASFIAGESETQINISPMATTTTSSLSAVLTLVSLPGAETPDCEYAIGGAFVQNGFATAANLSATATVSGTTPVSDSGLVSITAGVDGPTGPQEPVNPTSTASSTTSTYVDVPQKQDGSARIKVTALLATGTTASHVLWKVTGGTGSPQTGDFGSGLIQTITLPSASSGTIFTVTVGYDVNSNGVLDASEVKRTMQVYSMMPHIIMFNGAYATHAQNGTKGNADFIEIGTEIGVAKVYDQSSGDDATKDLLWAIDADHDHTITDAEIKHQIIDVIGYSCGGPKAINFANDLNHLGGSAFGYTIASTFQVQNLITIDPVLTFRWSKPIESNVKNFINYYEDKGGDAIFRYTTPPPANSRSFGDFISELISGYQIGDAGIDKTVHVVRVDVTTDATIKTEAFDANSHFDLTDKATRNYSLKGEDVNHDTIPWFVGKLQVIQNIFQY